MTLGASLFHLLQPNQAIDEDDDDDNLSMVTFLGGSYMVASGRPFDIMPTVGIELQSETPNDENKLRFHGGVELGLLEERPLALRAGLTAGPATELSLGFGFNKDTNNGLGLGVDAAYLMPMGDMESGGSIIVGLTVEFGKAVEKDWTKIQKKQKEDN